MESLIRRIDVPPSPAQNINVELTAYLLIAGETVGVGQPVPAQLAPALMQLRSTFTYKDYELLETLWMRNRVGNSKGQPEDSYRCLSQMGQEAGSLQATISLLHNLPCDP